MSVCLVVCVRGEAFERYAEQMVESAKLFFHPSEDGQVLWLEAAEGWPDASSARYGVILQNVHRISEQWVFLIDADSRFEAEVGPEILADGITVTTHPGWPTADSPGKPYCRIEGSQAYVHPSAERQYHPGAFVGGRTADFLRMAVWIENARQADVALGIYPEWYDESYLNRYLTQYLPALVLPGDYCFWDYWGGGGPNGETRKIVHLDKTPEEFANRG